MGNHFGNPGYYGYGRRTWEYSYGTYPYASTYSGAYPYASTTYGAYPYTHSTYGAYPYASNQRFYNNRNFVKRDADAEPEAEADADAAYYFRSSFGHPQQYYEFRNFHGNYRNFYGNYQNYYGNRYGYGYNRW